MEIVFKNYKILTLEENKKILEIRNLENVRKNSNTMEIIQLENHLKWVNNLDNSKNLYYAVELDGKIVGGVNLVNINSIEKTAYWGVFFSDDNLPFISSIVTYIFLDRTFNILYFNKLFSEVIKSNISAYRFSINFGLKVKEEFYKNDILYYDFCINKEEWNKNKESKYIKMISKRVNNIKYNFIDTKDNSYENR